MAKDKKKEVQRKETKEKMADGQKLSCTVFYFGSGGLRSRHNSNPQGGFFWSGPLPSKCPISTDSTKHTFTLSIRKTGSMARLTPLLFSFSFTCNLICTGFRWKRRAHTHTETQTDKQLSAGRKHEALSGVSGTVEQGIMDEFFHFWPSRIHRVNRYERTVKTTSKFSRVQRRVLTGFTFLFSTQQAATLTSEKWTWKTSTCAKKWRQRFLDWPLGSGQFNSKINTFTACCNKLLFVATFPMKTS